MNRRTPRHLLLVAACAGTLAAPGAYSGASAAAADDPLRVAVFTSTDKAATAQLFDVAVQINDPAAESYSVLIEWGDGTNNEYERQVSCAPGSSSDPLNVRVPARKAYRVAGDYAINVRVRTDGCTAASETATASTTVKVTPGATPTNGPHATRLTFSSFRVDHAARRLGLGLDAADPDGNIREVTVRWGDGKTSRVAGRSCTDPVRHWPESRQHVELLHTYTGKAKEFTVTATAVATGCDGSAATSKTVTRRLVFR